MKLEVGLSTAELRVAIRRSRAARGVGAMGERAQLRPVTLREARRFVAEHHRHSRAPQGGLFAVAVVAGSETLGVGIAGRPVARALDDGVTVEVVRICTLGEMNVPSMLYAALCRAAKALGYVRAVTYTLATEPGTSLRACGWRRDGDVRARDWNTPSRPRRTLDLFGEPVTAGGAKVRWARTLR